MRKSVGTLVVDSSEFSTTANHHKAGASSSKRRDEKGDARRGRRENQDPEDTQEGSRSLSRGSQGSRSLSRGGLKRTSLYVTPMRTDSSGPHTAALSQSEELTVDHERPNRPGLTKRRSSLDLKPVSNLKDLFPKDDFEKNMAPGNSNDSQITMPLRQLSRRELSGLSDHKEVPDPQQMAPMHEVDESEDRRIPPAPVSPSDKDLPTKAKTGSPSDKTAKKKAKTSKGGRTSCSPNNAGFRKVVPTKGASPKRKGKKRPTGKQDDSKGSKRQSDSEEKVLVPQHSAQSEDCGIQIPPSPSEEVEEDDTIHSSTEREAMLDDDKEVDPHPNVHFHLQQKQPEKIDHDSISKHHGEVVGSERLSVTGRSMTDFSLSSHDDKIPVISTSPIAPKKDSSPNIKLKAIGRLFGRKGRKTNKQEPESAGDNNQISTTKSRESLWSRALSRGKRVKAAGSD
ncbi:MAG: hypothetical protein SGBAC_012969 [Bacillariaceae sp.]